MFKAANCCTRRRSRQGSACRVHVVQHYRHRRSLGQAGPQVRSDVRQEGLRSLVKTITLFIDDICKAPNR